MFNKIATSVIIAAFGISSATVEEILDRIEANQSPQTSRSEVTQIVYQPSDRENVSKLISYSFNKGEKGLMEYIEPARIRGMKILMLNDGDDIWFYSPRTARVRKIASHQKNQAVNNSDFSYEDMSSKDMREDYTVKLEGEEQKRDVACYKLIALPKKENISYSKTVSWVDKERYIPVEMHFFDENGELWKTLTTEGAQKTGSYWSFKQITMSNVLKGSKTVMKFEKIENDIELDGSMFSERYLSR